MSFRSSSRVYLRPVPIISTADIIMPGVQKPHWTAASSTKACWISESSPVGDCNHIGFAVLAAGMAFGQTLVYVGAGIAIFCAIGLVTVSIKQIFSSMIKYELYEAPRSVLYP